MKDGSFSLIPFNPFEFKTASTLKLATLQLVTKCDKKTVNISARRDASVDTNLFKLINIIDCSLLGAVDTDARKANTKAKKMASGDFFQPQSTNI